MVGLLFEMSPKITRGFKNPKQQTTDLYIHHIGETREGLLGPDFLMQGFAHFIVVNRVSRGSHGFIPPCPTSR